jgi:hypothetical protein
MRKSIGDRFGLCEAPSGPFRQTEPVPFVLLAGIKPRSFFKTVTGF